MRSMPTSETRTHASITIPLSSTRSRTSIRLVPPAALSTGIGALLQSSCVASRGAVARRRRRPAARERLLPPPQRPHLLAQLLVLGRQRLLARRQMVIEFPPVEAD